MKLLLSLTVVLALSGGAAMAGDNFKICAAADNSDFREPQIVIPPQVIFISWGPLVGNLMNPGHDPAYEASDQKHFAVETTEDVTFTKAAKCATTKVVGLISNDDGWKQPPTNMRGLFFQAINVEKYLDDLNMLPHHLGDYIQMGILNGTPIAEIAYAKTLR